VTRFAVVPERSTVWIEARSSVHPIHTRTDGLEGFVELGVDSHGRVDLARTPTGRLSLRVDRLRSGNMLEERELRRRIDARRFPTIDGELLDMRPAVDGDRYTIRGAITFRGVTKEHEGEMHISFHDDTVTLVGASRFDIRDYGMEPPRVLMLRVDPDVAVRVEIVAEVCAPTDA
jgi:polyisoprenoid-binding protein YceI